MTKLKVKPFISSDKHGGFGVSSSIIYGDREALLLDAQFTRSNAHRLVAEILELDRDLTQIFISHMHPDHYLGLQIVKEAFPNARVMAYREAADQVNAAFEFKIEHWGKVVLGRNGANKHVEVERIEEDTLYVEGTEVKIIGLTRGDAELMSALWVPSIRTLCAVDFCFSDAHVWVADARTPADRQAWLDNLDMLEALDPAVVIPGHAPSDRPYDPDCIGFTRRYLTDFIAELGASSDSSDLRDRMKARYPDAAVEICLYYSSKILRDGYVWDGDWPESLKNTPAVI